MSFSIFHALITLRSHNRPDTNVLVTRFLTTQGVGQLVDFMPVIRGGSGADVYFPSGKNAKKETLIASCSHVQESDISTQTTPGSRSNTPSTPSGGGSFAFLNSSPRTSSPTVTPSNIE